MLLEEGSESPPYFTPVSLSSATSICALVMTRSTNLLTIGDKFTVLTDQVRAGVLLDFLFGSPIFSRCREYFSTVILPKINLNYNFLNIFKSESRV